MKCELCHKADAKTAIQREKANGEEEELYVCDACAKADRLQRQKKSHRTRKISCDGVEMSITEINGGDGEMPPFLGAIVGAFSDLANELERTSKHGGERARKDRPASEALVDFPLDRVEAAFALRGGMHLEGLSLIGEIDAVKRAARALKMELVGIDADGVHDSGHVYRLRYSGSLERAKRVVGDILREERNARIRLLEDMSRVFGDSICRALAIVKNCRMLSNGELFDMLSPLRLAALERLLDGITLKTIEKLMNNIDLSDNEDDIDVAERDQRAAERADDMNRRFEDVMLNDKAERRFL